MSFLNLPFKANWWLYVPPA